MFKKITGAALLCLLATAAMGADTPVTQGYRDFSGGLNNFQASVSLNANESPDLMNVVIDEPVGALVQRKGRQTCGNTPSGLPATNLYEFVKNDGSRNLIVTDNITVWQTADCHAFTTIVTGLSDSNTPRFATIQDELWIVNGSTWPMTWDSYNVYRLDGLNGHPVGWKAKYINFWKSRVWLANTPTSPSSIYFSLVKDADGNVLSPKTSTAAWSSINNIYINRDDGSSITGVRPYRANLYVWKETGISRIIFESEYQIGEDKNVTTIGSKFNEGIVEMDDGIIRYIGRDGEYGFDGSTVKRLSTKWTPTFESISQAVQSDKYFLWNTVASFGQGTMDKPLHISTTETGGIKISTSVPVEPNGSLQLGTTAGWSVAFSSQSLTYSAPAYASSQGIIGAANTSCSTPSHIRPKATWEIYSSTGLYASLTCTGTNGDCYPPVVVPVANSLGMYAQMHISTGDCAGYYLRSPVITDSRKAIKFYSGTSIGFNMSGQLTGVSYSVALVPYTPSTATYVSAALNAAGVTRWGTFNVEATLNGGTADYYARTAASTSALSAAPWTPIINGAKISTTTNAWMDWMVNLTGSDTDNPPQINSVAANWTLGGDTKALLYATNYKSRYWLAASTTPGNQYNDMVMVESKSPLGTHTRYDLPVSAFVVWNQQLYGAIGNTSKIVHLDFGDTDDGAAIASYWESRDELFGNPLNYKSINRLIVDYSALPLNPSLSVGLSDDFGATWQTSTFSTAMYPNLVRATTIRNPAANRALQFRTGIFNKTLGSGFTLYGLHPFGTASDFFGNK